jgi:hypothetical protein
MAEPRAWVKRWKLHRPSPGSPALHTMMHEIVSRQHEVISHQPGPATHHRGYFVSTFKIPEAGRFCGVISICNIRNLYGGVGVISRRSGVEWSGVAGLGWNLDGGWMVDGWWMVDGGG